VVNRCLIDSSAVAPPIFTRTLAYVDWNNTKYTVYEVVLLNCGHSKLDGLQCVGPSIKDVRKKLVICNPSPLSAIVRIWLTRFLSPMRTSDSAYIIDCQILKNSFLSNELVRYLLRLIRVLEGNLDSRGNLDARCVENVLLYFIFCITQ